MRFVNWMWNFCCAFDGMLQERIIDDNWQKIQNFWLGMKGFIFKSLNYEYKKN